MAAADLAHPTGRHIMEELRKSITKINEEHFSKMMTIISENQKQLNKLFEQCLTVLDDGAEEADFHDDSADDCNCDDNAEIDETDVVVLKETIESVEQKNTKTSIIAPELFDTGNPTSFNLNFSHKLPKFELYTTIASEMFDESTKKGKLEVVIESELKDKIGEENDKLYEVVGEAYEVHSTVEIEVLVGCKIEAKSKIGIDIKLIGEFDISLEVALQENLLRGIYAYGFEKPTAIIKYDPSHDWGEDYLVVVKKELEEKPRYRRYKFFGKSTEKMVVFLHGSVGIIHKNYAESVTASDHNSNGVHEGIHLSLGVAAEYRKAVVKLGGETLIVSQVVARGRSGNDFHVTFANQARTALNMLRENRNRFVLIIIDVHSPDMDGFRLLKLVGLEMEPPVILLLAYSDPKLVMKGITHGVCDYLVQPVQVEKLRNIGQQVVRKIVDHMINYDQASWNFMLMEYATNGYGYEALNSYVLQRRNNSLDIHAGQSYFLLVTMDQNAISDYYIAASARVVNQSFWQRVTSVAKLHYSQSTKKEAGPLFAAPGAAHDKSFVVKQALSVRQWQDCAPEHATWGSWLEFSKLYPDSHLEDKVLSEGVGNDTA